MVLHADPGRLWFDKVVAVVKTRRLRETELYSAKAFENYSVETDLDYTGGCQEFSSVTRCLVTRTLHLSPMPVSPMLHTRSTSVRPDKFMMCAAVYRSTSTCFCPN